MKKNILNKLIFTLILALNFTVSFAQFHIDKDFHVANNGIVYVNGVQVTFSATSTTTSTTRTATTYGKLWMNAASSIANLTLAYNATTNPIPTTAHFIDGYVRSNRTTSFLYPVGQSGVLGIARTIGTTTDNIDVAFYRASASTTIFAPAVVVPTLSSNIQAVSSEEYWDMISSGSATVTLTWRSSSNFSTLGVNYATQLGIAGLNVSNNKWELIPSTIDATSILGGSSIVANGAGTADDTVASTGSITTNAAVNLANYRYITFARVKEGCFPDVVAGTTKTWDGAAWSPVGAPTEVNPVIINGTASSPGSFTCFSLQLTTDVTLGVNEFIDCVNNVTGTGKIIMNTSSNFRQRNSSATAPTINLKKVANDERLNDWTYFGSPLASGKLTAMETAKAVGGTLDKAYYSYRYWRTGLATSTAENWWGVHSNTSNPSYLSLPNTETAITGTNKTGLGFIARVKNQAPFTSLVTQSNIEFDLNGLSNNGDFSVPSSSVVTTGTTNGPGNTRLTLGNPYPSNLNADIFLRENPNITGTLYFWSSKTQFSTSGTSNTAFYTGSDFVSYNLSGGTASGSGAQAPNNVIHSAQGFDVYTTVASSPIVFNNCMRLTTGTPTTFYKNSNETESQSNNVEKNRFWVNVSNANNDFFSEALIAYIPETTLGYDRMYDGVSASTSEYTITSLLNNEKFAIQSRAEFNALDVVPLHIKKASTYAGTMTISLSNKEGIFSSNDVTIFLHDKDLNVFHNLEMSNYTFTLNELDNSSRFEIVYQSTLNNQDFTINPVNISLFDNNLKVNAKDLISNITIFDISGRLIETYKGINNIEFVSNFNHEGGIYIAKVVLQNGNTTSQKITNLNK